MNDKLVRMNLKKTKLSFIQQYKEKKFGNRRQ